MELTATLISKNLGSLLSKCNLSNEISHNQFGTLTLNSRRRNQNRITIFNPPDQMGTISKSKEKKHSVNDKVTIINNHSLRKLQVNHKRKKRSLESLYADQLPLNVRRYNMSKDAKIDFSSKQPPKPRFHKSPSPPKQLCEDSLLRKQRNTESLIRPRSRNIKISEIINAAGSQDKMSETFEFNYQINKPRQYFPKRKLWSSAKVIVGRQASPRDQFTITNSNYRKEYNNSSLDHSLDRSAIPPIEQPLSKPPQEPRRRIKRQKLVPLSQTCNAQPAKRRFYTRSRHCKQLYIHKMSKRDEGICAWGIQQDADEDPSSVRQYEERGGET